MENQIQNPRSEDRHLATLRQIQEAGNVSPVGFVKKIKHLKKIRQMEASQCRPILGLLFTKVFNLSGFKGRIDEIHKADIMQLMFERYGHLSLEEIDYAFRHDRYSGEPIEHFQLFNAEYVAKILKRYADFVMQVKNENHLKLQEPAVEKIVSEDEKKKIREQFLKIVFEDLTAEGYSDSAWILYEDIKPKLSIRKEVLIRLFEIQKKKLQKQKRTDRFNVSAVTGSVENRCRSIVACNYLRKYLTDFETFRNSIEG